MVSIINKQRTGSLELDRHLDCIRGVDWTQTSLGHIEIWPQDIVQLLHVMLLEPNPRMMLLGPEKWMIYNPAFAALVPEDHPKALGTRFNELWEGRLCASDFEAFDGIRGAEHLSHFLGNRHFSVRCKRGVAESNLDWTIIPLANHAHGFYVSISHKDCEATLDSTPRSTLQQYPGSPTLSCHQKVEPSAKKIVSEDYRSLSMKLYESMESSDTGVFVFDPLGRLVEANEAYCRSSGLPQPGSEAAKKPHTFMDYVYAPDAELAMAAWKNLTQGHAATFEMRWKTPKTADNDKGYLWILAACVPYVKNGVLDSVVGCTTVISSGKLKQAEAYAGLNPRERAQHSDGLFQLQKVIAAASVGIAEYLTDGTPLWRNESFYKFTGIPQDLSESVAMDFMDYVHAQSVEAAKTSWQTAMTGKTYNYELSFKAELNEHGEDYHWCLCVSQPLFDDDGNVMSVLLCLTDVSQQKRSEQERRQIEERLFQLTEYAPIGIVMSDSSFTLNYANDKWFELSGHPSVPPEDVEWLSIIYEEDVSRIMGEMQKLMAGEVTTFEFRLRKMSKESEGPASPAWVVSTCVPGMDEDGRLKHIIATITDISSLKWAERVQMQRVEEAIEARRQQENFIDMTSHEIRNPLGAVVHCADSISESLSDMTTLVDELCASSDDEKVRRLKSCVENSIDSVKTISSCTAHQKRIVDDILVLSKLDSNLLQISPVRCRVGDILKGLEKMFVVESEREKIAFKTEADSSLKDKNIDWLLLDHGRITQILINLVTNALKFIKNRATRAVTVRMGVATAKPSENSFRPPVDFALAQAVQDSIFDTPEFSKQALYLWFTVEDTGIGMTPEEKLRIFSRFAQGSPRTYGEYGGSGLGLFISATLSSMQGGEIGVASVAGVGSTFAFYVRTSACEPADTLSDRVSGISLSNRSGDAKSANGSIRTSVLVVEDNLLNQKVLKKQLTKYYEVYTADNGQEALDFLQSTSKWTSEQSSTKRVDVILMDIEMPILNGLEAAKRIRELQKEGQIRGPLPIIAVSANARPEQMKQAIAAGMDDSISKPFRISDLLPKIDRFTR